LNFPAINCKKFPVPMSTRERSRETLIRHQKNKKPRCSRNDGVLEYFGEEKTNTNEVNILWHKEYFRMNMKLRKANLD
jgi:hypothetical protein